MDAVILAGGAGTRLRSIVHDVPKPMADVGGRPFLEYLLEHLAAGPVDRIILSVCHRREVIIDRFGDRFRDLPIVYSVEEEPLGTGGAIRQSLELARGEHVAVLNGDTFFPVDLAAMANAHRSRDCDLTMALKPLTRFDRYGVVACSGDRVVGFAEKGFRETGSVNGGVYVMRRALSAALPSARSFSFETDFLMRQVDALRICPFASDAWFIDIGVPEDYRRAQRELPGRVGSSLVPLERNVRDRNQ